MADEVDRETVAWAQATVVGRRPSTADRVRAYRILAAWKPRGYRLKLAQALLKHGRQAGSGRLDLLQEAATAVRCADLTAAPEFELAFTVLHGYQFALYQAGRRADGDAVCAELGALARRAGGRRTGLDTWARCLAENGRHAQAADVCAEVAEARRPTADDTFAQTAFLWHLVELAAQAALAGRTEQAHAVLAEVIESERDNLARDRAQERVLFHLLVYQAWMAGTDGRTDLARAAEAEALELIERVVRAGGERKEWSGYQSVLWTTLLAASTAPVERSGAGSPVLAFGWSITEWSPDLREAYCANIDALAEAAATETDLPALARLRRLVAVRTAVRYEWHGAGAKWPEHCWPVFDDSVAAARRFHDTGAADGTAALAQALTDRAGLAAAAGRYEQALHDLTEAARTN